MSPKRIAKPLDLYIRVSDMRGRSGESSSLHATRRSVASLSPRARGYEIGEVFEG